MATVNPGTIPGKTQAERKRIPMNAPVSRLETAEIPGYHLHWFRDDPQRIERAKQAGYEFVMDKEVAPPNVSLGGSSAVSGNMDMGSAVSTVSVVGKDAVRLVLMKIKQELFEEDQRLLERRSQQVVEALSAGMVGAGQQGAGDTSNRYVDKARTSMPDFFKAKRPMPQRSS